MMILRYFAWAQVYHWLTFYKQNPLAFIFGVLLFPYHLITRLAYPPETHDEVVLGGIEGLKSYWQIPDAVLPPKFIERKFLQLESEIKSR